MNTEKNKAVTGELVARDKFESVHPVLDAAFASIQCACAEAKVNLNYNAAYDLLEEAMASCHEAMNKLEELADGGAI